ncbi:v-SNARE [Ascobolus immersus RN42]|uniref:V-SNARE n=1 Tax=Ascobolus immersus RN42 TaxID=1160509 RepID=A0A3N4IM78_ASCIM|nr:v-SNARE [Ascobolus immersus RN42]
MSSRYPRRDGYPQTHLSAPSQYGYSAKDRSSPRPYDTGGYISSHRSGPEYRPNASSSNTYGQNAAYRSATPNSRGQFSAATMEELESQNEDQFSGLRGKVRMMKEMSEAIGVEIRESNTLIENMNNHFETTRVRLKGTMNRMLIMAQKSGIGWRVWLMFFLLVFGVFAYVWLF